MKLHSLVCPHCGAPLYIESDFDSYKCEHCDRVIIREEIESEIIQAKLKLKLKDKELNYRKQIKDRQYEQEKYTIDAFEKRKHKDSQMKFIMVFALAMLIIIFYISLYVLITIHINNEKQESLDEEFRLQVIVDEVIADINSKDFENAYIKASSIYYTSSWSNETEKKWDSTRKALLEQIESAEKAYIKEQKELAKAEEKAQKQLEKDIKAAEKQSEAERKKAEKLEILSPDKGTTTDSINNIFTNIRSLFPSNKKVPS